MDIALTAADLDEALGLDGCVLVPTMGALHAGHLSLMSIARQAADELDLPLAASIFVNPAQFNDPRDLEAYPRPLRSDLEALMSAGVEVAFVPTVEAIYPPDEPHAAPQPDLPGVATEPGLEDLHRPGHFGGVCRVVSRLFDLCRPAAAVFGEKDWQQLRVVAAMTEAQGRATRIIPGPTVREADGLAMSSRNARLSEADRVRACAISRGLRAACAQPEAQGAQAVLMDSILRAGLEPEYAVVRDADTLTRTPAQGGPGPWRVLAAARLSGVRLLDNAPWPA